MRRGTVRKHLMAVLGAAFAVCITIASFVIDHARAAHDAVSFTPREIEHAQREVLPYRQSGLIFHWADDSPTVYVTRSMWEALPEDSRRELGRAIAIAKRRERITILDETLSVKLAVCTARGRCTRPGD